MLNFSGLSVVYSLINLIAPPCKNWNQKQLICMDFHVFAQLNEVSYWLNLRSYILEGHIPKTSA